MNQSDLDTLLHDIEELRRAVRRNNPFLAQVLASRFYSALTAVIGTVVVAICLGTQFLIGRWGSFAATPWPWRASFWTAAILTMVLGGGMKWVMFNRKARLIAKDANYLTVLRAFYAGSWFHVNVPAYACAVCGMVFAFSLGHPWYALPVGLVFAGLLFNNVGVSIQKAEYLVSGWYAIVTSLASFMFFERAPFLWTAVVLGGFCLAFGIAGLIRNKREEADNGHPR